MAKQIINGNNLMLFDKDGRSYAYATNHTLSIEASTIEVSSHDSGLVNNQLLNGYSWSITSENLYTTEEYRTLFDSMVKGDHIQLYFGFKWETDKSVIDDKLSYYNLDKSNIYYTGNAIITSLKVNSNNKEHVTYSIEFEGVGEFKHAVDWVDVSSILPNKGLYSARESPTQLNGWSDSSDPSTIAIVNTNTVYWRATKKDATVTATYEIPRAGTYKLTVYVFCANENYLGNFGLRGGTFQINGQELLTEGTNSICVGKSTTQLTPNDLSYTDNGVTYYVPNRDNSESVKAYFDKGYYKVTQTVTRGKGSKITLKMGQNNGGSRTHVVYSNITLTYIQ